MLKRLGPTSTPTTNPLTVRPREMRAINAPAEGPRAIQVAQKKMVQLPSHSASPASKALILKLWGTGSARYTPSSWVKVLSCRIVGPTGLPGMKAYDFRLPEENIVETQEGRICGAVDEGEECNFGEIFETDGRTEALDLTVLT